MPALHGTVLDMTGLLLGRDAVLVLLTGWEKLRGSEFLPSAWVAFLDRFSFSTILPLLPQALAHSIVLPPML